MTQSYELAQELLDQLGWACPESEKRVIANFITAQREKIIAALRSDGEQCDCFAKEECECACGAWDGYKTISIDRAIEIVESCD